MQTINFHINYETHFGEELCLHVLMPDAKGKVSEQKFMMDYRGNGLWVARLRHKFSEDVRALDYFFTMNVGGEVMRSEWCTIKHRLVLPAARVQTIQVYNRWNAMPEDSYRYSVAFTDTLNHQHIQPLTPGNYAQTLRLTVRAPQLLEGQQLVVVGDKSALGQWDSCLAVEMTQHNHNTWTIDLNAATLEGRTVELKFAIKQQGVPGISLWEEGRNRTIDAVRIAEGELVEYELDQAFFAQSDQRVAGTLVPVFSLRSEGGFGVGDFGDLRMMVDWVRLSGQRVLQILPINDTTTTHTWTDSYPYSCISIFALHPQYADLRQLPALKDTGRRKYYEELRVQLNALPQIDYEVVNQAKVAYLHELFEQEGAAVLKSDAFECFFAECEQWLVPYAHYCYLRDSLGTSVPSDWKGNETWNEKDRKALSTPGSKAYANHAFYYYVQFVLADQLAKAHDHARQQGVILKGDIPIGVSRTGCDVWMEPNYFNMNGQAGAPPDDFSVNGQNWGFPTYNWEAMLADGCQWWVRRFQNMSRYFDAYRIDHVLGFFRIWEIPIEAVHGLLGQFSPSLGLTPQEIESYGLSFNEHHFTTPFISDWILDRIFGGRALMVKDQYLNHLHDDIWELKPEYNTERKIEAAFRHTTIQEDLNLRDGLYALASNVLFVRDRKQNGTFHPRISAQLSLVYEALWDCDKDAFNRLYNDYYYRRNNNFWYNEAMKKLPRLVEATRMLVCAEDLGMVPACVEWVMNELRILSLEVQSMPKDSSVKFGMLSRNPYRSVCTISSHDMPTLRQWWDENWDRTQEYYNLSLGRLGAAPHPLPGWLARDILAANLQSPSMLCILSIQDWLSIDEQLRLPDADAERINIPANPKHYWRYRMHLSIEQLLSHETFTQQVKDLAVR